MCRAVRQDDGAVGAPSPRLPQPWSRVTRVSSAGHVRGGTGHVAGQKQLLPSESLQKRGEGQTRHSKISAELGPGKDNLERWRAFYMTLNKPFASPRLGEKYHNFLITSIRLGEFSPQAKDV